MTFLVTIELNAEKLNMKQLDNGYWRQSYSVENVYYDSRVFDSHDSIIDYIILLWKYNKHFENKIPLLNESYVRDKLEANQQYHEEQEKYAIEENIMGTIYVIYPDEDKDNENYLRHCKLNDIIDYIEHQYKTHSFRNLHWDELNRIPPLINIKNVN